MRALLIAAALSAATPALAAAPVALRSEILDADGLVTLGELFEGAGPAGATRVATRAGATVVLDAGAVQSAARRAGLAWANAEGVRRIIVRGASAGATTTKANVEVLTYARNLNAGEIVQPQDLVWGKVAAVPSGGAVDPESMIGLAARRPLRAGSPVSARDVVAPQVIKAGDLVTVVYDEAGISLSLQAKAMGSAAAGDALAVQNTASKKIIQAVAVAPGQAAVGPGALALRARKSQHASR